MEFLESLDWNLIHNALVLLMLLVAWKNPERMWEKQETTRKEERDEEAGSVMQVLAFELEKLEDECKLILQKFEELEPKVVSPSKMKFPNPFNAGVAIGFWISELPLLSRPDVWCRYSPARCTEEITEINHSKNAYMRAATTLRDSNSRYFTQEQYDDIRAHLENVLEKSPEVRTELSMIKKLGLPETAPE